ncbi:MAG: TetR/AcrR family transcriptional regulator [Firmicutes bacterium]|nr:TetR/AcrR family transcriptional regulator [Bacillota bacterium]
MEKMNQSKKILIAAFECISSKGYANVSLRDIADKAGVVLSQLNYYYKNKEGLFTEVIKMMMQKYLQEVENCLKKGTNAKEKISSLITYFQKILEDNPKLFRLLYDFTSMALWSVSFSKLLCNLFEDLANLIESHVLNNIPEKMNLKGYSPKSIARMLFGAMFGTAIQVILDPQEKKLPEALKTIELVFE